MGRRWIWLDSIVYLVTFRAGDELRRVYEFADRRDAERVVTELCLSGYAEVELFEARYLERL